MGETLVNLRDWQDVADCCQVIGRPHSGQVCSLAVEEQAYPGLSIAGRAPDRRCGSRGRFSYEKIDNLKLYSVLPGIIPKCMRRSRSYECLLLGVEAVCIRIFTAPASCTDEPSHNKPDSILDSKGVLGNFNPS